VVKAAHVLLFLAAGLGLASSGCSSLLGITEVIQAPDGAAGNAGTSGDSAGAVGSIAGEPGGGTGGVGGASGGSGAGGNSDVAGGPGGILFRGGIGTLAPSSGRATASIRLVRPYLTIGGASVCGASLCMKNGGILP
jgi:hypothetical protein